MGGEIVPKKGARLAWVLGNQYLIVTGFSKQSQREVMVFKVGEKFDTVEKLHTEILDVSPSILIPHYDEDSSTLFLTSKVSNWLINIGFSHRVCNSFSKNESTLHSGWKWLKMSYFFRVKAPWQPLKSPWSFPTYSPCHLTAPRAFT